MERGDRFDNAAVASGWSNAGHNKPSGIQTNFPGQLSLSLGRKTGVVKCYLGFEPGELIGSSQLPLLANDRRRC